MSNFPALVHTLHCIHCVSKKFISQVLYEVKWSFWLCSLWWKLHVFEVEYMQYPIVRNGDQRWALEFLKKYQFLNRRWPQRDVFISRSLKITTLSNWFFFHSIFFSRSFFEITKFSHCNLIWFLMCPHAGCSKHKMYEARLQSFLKSSF